jgi:hypothetical protein
MAILLAGGAGTQQEQPPAQQPGSKPQVKVNVLNVCSPQAEELEVIKGGLARVPAKPSFGRDFEVSRGRTTPPDSAEARFVRLRRDFPPESPLLTAQYSMSTDDKNTVELLVLRLRDPREFHEIALEDRVSANATSPTAILAVDTPVARVRIERIAKSSVVLARCEGADQSANEALFRQATEIMAKYRSALGLRGAFRSDISWLSSASKPAGPAGKSAARKP